jgi:hypothetical protein
VAAPRLAAQLCRNQSPVVNPFPPAFPDQPNISRNPIPQPELAESNPGPMLQENQKEMRRTSSSFTTCWRPDREAERLMRA